MTFKEEWSPYIDPQLKYPPGVGICQNCLYNTPKYIPQLSEAELVGGCPVLVKINILDSLIVNVNKNVTFFVIVPRTITAHV